MRLTLQTTTLLSKRRTLVDYKFVFLWSTRVPLMTVASRLRLSSDFEVGAAAAIHPNSVLVASPCLPLNTGLAAVLANQLDFSARSFGAIMALPVAGLAIEVLNVMVTVAVTV